jgi:glycosyltransferase involved in cell wall biosynthesis
LRLAKGGLVLAAMATGALHHAAGFAGRDDLSRGLLVRRARDPALCSAHSRNRAAIRAELGLPAARPLVGVFGALSARKNVPLIAAAIKRSGTDAGLVLAGAVEPAVHDWLAGLDAVGRARVHVRDGFLPDDLLDRYVAAVDVVPLALTNNGPSGIMGKALAAGVPVVTAGSRVRAREVAATGGGCAAALTADGIGAAIRRLLAADAAPSRGTVPPATVEEFTAALLGLPGHGAVLSHRPWQRERR